jgi:hypothetical protein
MILLMMMSDDYFRWSLFSLMIALIAAFTAAISACCCRLLRCRRRRHYASRWPLTFSADFLSLMRRHRLRRHISLFDYVIFFHIISFSYASAIR